MGKKITIDSATMMNKGFEIIEAAHLFSIDESKIEVVVHRESIIHSAVEYIDNTVIAELSVPDMRACVQYAVDYPDRTEAVIEPLDLFSVGSLSFMRPDYDAFPLLSLNANILPCTAAKHIPCMASLSHFHYIFRYGVHVLYSHAHKCWVVCVCVFWHSAACGLLVGSEPRPSAVTAET